MRLAGAARGSQGACTGEELNLTDADRLMRKSRPTVRRTTRPVDGRQSAGAGFLSVALRPQRVGGGRGFDARRTRFAGSGAGGAGYAISEVHGGRLCAGGDRGRRRRHDSAGAAAEAGEGASRSGWRCGRRWTAAGALPLADTVEPFRSGDGLSSSCCEASRRWRASYGLQLRRLHRLILHSVRPAGTRHRRPMVATPRFGRNDPSFASAPS